MLIKYIKTVLFLLLATQANVAQPPNLKRWEYWFNDRYNERHAANIDLPSATINQAINTDGLPKGLHLLHVRTQDQNGLWSPTLSRFFVKSGTTAATNSIDRTEYWLDNQFATRTIVGNPSGNQTVNTALDVAALPTGLHLFHIRTADKRGQYSSVSSTLFVKLPDDKQPAAVLTTLEYWYNNGYSAKTNQPINNSKVFIIDSEFDIATLPQGLNMLHYRLMDSKGRYSSVESSMFIKMPPSTTDVKLVNAEYWFNNGESGVVSLPISTSGNIIIDSKLITEKLPTGLHQLHFRALDNKGRWSSVQSAFFVKNNTPQGAMLVEMEYWFDDNYMGAKTYALQPLANQTVEIKVSDASLLIGPHVLNYRFRDSKGQWSVPQSTGYTQTVMATGVKQANSSSLAVYPNPATSVLNIDFKSSIGKDAVFELYSAQGNLEQITKEPSFTGKITLSVSDLPPGIYLLKITIDNETHLKKVMVK